ncbi:MAG: AAA family ATPase [Phycisphaerales bacterium]|nr:AAA family ATPase [Phycisphaerales bacterium]
MNAIVLIGARGSGKSSVAAQLGPEMGRLVVDLDAEALTLAGQDSITQVFAEDGEAHWRTLEAAALVQALQHPLVLIDAGGGVGAIDPARSTLMRARRDQHAVAVWIRCSPEVMVARLGEAPGDRPALSGQSTVAEEAQAIANARAEAYAAAADGIVNGDASVDAVVDEIKRWWTARFGEAPQ